MNPSSFTQDTLSSQIQLDGLKSEILEVIRSQLVPLAKRYGYDSENLQNVVSGKPLVLIIGNYSAGKSTLINHLVGHNVQRTGQAPTDDSFTVLTHLEGHPPGTVKLRDGRALLAEEGLPLHRLKDHGERFLAHMQLKQVSSDILRNIAIIDTPGMLDSISEKDRGYKYQEVIGELAAAADLVLLLFDAHKAGTVRESYLSLRDTLPKATMEDRVLFVLNRVDECQSVDDLLRVHGALCWNLSQMTGRKDIPRIYLTYTLPETEGTGSLSALRDDLLRRYLETIASHKEEVIQQIMNIPRKRMDHLATHVEVHSHRLGICTAALKAYSKYLSRVRFSITCWWGLISLSLLAILATFLWGPLGGAAWSQNLLGISSLAIGSIVGPLIIITTIILGRSWYRFRMKNIQKSFLDHITKYVPLKSQYDRDQWPRVLPKIQSMISSFSTINKKQFNQDQKTLRAIEKQMIQIRRKTGELRLKNPWKDRAKNPPSTSAPTSKLEELSSSSSHHLSAEKSSPLAHIIGEQVSLLGKLESKEPTQEHQNNNTSPEEEEETLLVVP